MEQRGHLRDGAMAKAAGIVDVTQGPGIAKGFVFLSLEDETGMCQAILRPDLFRENRALAVGSPALVVEGRPGSKTASSPSAPSVSSW